MNRKYLLELFSIYSITIIFAEPNKILWDFGVAIKTSVLQSSSDKNIQLLSDLDIEPPSQVKALIADPFISPTLSSINKSIYDPSYFLEYLDYISDGNIHKVKLLAGRLTMQIDYQPIIDMISQIDCNQLNENDCIDLNYWLANALLHVGKYREAENVIHATIPFTTDDRFQFLLAMNYESQGKIKEAQDEYLRFINKFPKSDYKVTALIKTRMLGRH
tara:strand:- start:87 stop:740 length:654 start_codon:yes stop_codon:yes gene_type:complete